MRNLLPALLACSILSACHSDTSTSASIADPAPALPNIGFAVTKTFPHDTTLFTEGFLVHNGRLYESTGSPNYLGWARSLVGPIDTATGRLDHKIELDKKIYFGEGISFIKNKLYQLTYENQVAFVYDAGTFKPEGQFKFANRQGWSLTTNDTALIMSDGTDRLTFVNPDDFHPIRQLQVTLNGIPRDSLNELEYIKGYIYANIWEDNYIVKIDPATGKVVGKIDLQPLTDDAKQRSPNADVLNGIAYDAKSDKIYVTGKLWPRIYEISFPH